MSTDFPSAAREKSLIIILRLTSSVSILGSSCLLGNILGCERSKKLKLMKIRVLLGLSLSDFIYSFALFLATWPMPIDTDDGYFIWGNIGSQTTCDIQGKDTKYALQCDGICLRYASAYFLSSNPLAQLPSLC